MPNPSTLEMQQELNERRAEALNVFTLLTENPLLMACLLKKDKQSYRKGYFNAVIHVIIIQACLIFVFTMWGI